MTQDRVMLLIDADNVSVDVMEQAVRLLLNQHGALHVRRAYCTAESAVKHQAVFKHLGIKPMVNLAAGKNSTDIAMAVDAIDLVLAERPDVVVIASSDSDFAPLVQRLREKGCVVRGIGQQGKTGDETQGVYDDFTVLEHRKSAATSAPDDGRPARKAAARKAPAGKAAARGAAAKKAPAARKAAGKTAAVKTPARKAAGRKTAAAPAGASAVAPATAQPSPADAVPSMSAEAGAGMRAETGAEMGATTGAEMGAEMGARVGAGMRAKTGPKPSTPTAATVAAPAARPTPTPTRPAAPARAQARPGATSVDAVLACLPELARGQGLALNVAVQRLREAQLLGKNSSSLKLFAQLSNHFDLLPAGKPTQVRLRG